MQGARILARGDDGIICKLSAAPDKLVSELSLDFHLVHTRFQEAASPAAACLGDSAGPANKRDFRRRLNNAQAVHQTREPLIIVQRIKPLYLSGETGVPAFHNNMSALVLVRIQIHAVALTHQSMKQRAKLREPLDSASS